LFPWDPKCPLTPAGWGYLLVHFPFTLSSTEWAQHPSIEGRGTCGAELHGGEQDGQKGGDGVVEFENEPTSTH